MSALLLEIQPVVTAIAAASERVPTQLAWAAALAGALAPWLLLVGAYGGLARSAAACFAGPLPL